MKDPVAFPGTIRSNLDPFNDHDDQALWLVLEKSHLRQLVASFPGQLYHHIEDGSEGSSKLRYTIVDMNHKYYYKSIAF